MANVVYLPSERQQTFAGDLGGALGKMLGAEMTRRQQQEQNKKVQAFTEAIRTAPDRAAAMEIVSNYSAQFTSPQDFARAFQIVDEMKPVSAETVQPVTMYDPDGSPRTVGMTNEQFKRETDPNAMGTRFPGMSMTKPDLTEFYTLGEKPGDFKSLGKMPTNKRPEGAYTKDELALAAQTRRETRQAEEDARREARHDDRMAIAERNQLLAEQRLQRTLAGIGDRLGDRELNQSNSVVREATRLTAVMLNAKVLPDGSFGFDESNRAEQYRQHLDYINGKIAADPSILKKPGAASLLASEARKAIMGTEKPKDETLPPKPKESGGFIDKVKKRVTGSDKPQESKGKLNGGYKASNGKTYSAADVEAAAKKAGLSVADFIQRANLTKE